ncbi:adenosylcobinamide-phosphate synthase [Roseovarius sp. MBR-78]|uniref:adenosylcobinamide-phosphate synthase CbiB n=1 Tax=Roseovarius sp. MBR-78 TaxID=3156460 RepID=UPI003395C167
MSFAGMMLVGLAIDLALGWPSWLHARIGHPVTWLGAVIAALERLGNRGGRSIRIGMGALCVALVVALAVGPALLVQRVLPEGLWGVVIGGLLAWPLIALRSMHTHVAAVAAPLLRGDLEAARAAVAMIVGRDPALLDGAGVARAAIESLAENTGDGIVAPVFWGVVAGLPGIATYKAVNTLDSMIGHRNARYEAFGKVAARLDDLANLIPARITGVLFALAAPRYMARALRIMWRDARAHRSPNAGWSEAAMAGALGVRLSGPRAYGDRVSEEPWLNGAARDPGAADVRRALRLYARAMALMALALGALWLL